MEDPYSFGGRPAPSGGPRLGVALLPGMLVGRAPAAGTWRGRAQNQPFTCPTPRHLLSDCRRAQRHPPVPPAVPVQRAGGARGSNCLGRQAVPRRQQPARFMSALTALFVRSPSLPPSRHACRSGCWQPSTPACPGWGMTVMRPRKGRGPPTAPASWAAAATRSCRCDGGVRGHLRCEDLPYEVLRGAPRAGIQGRAAPAACALRRRRTPRHRRQHIPPP